MFADDVNIFCPVNIVDDSLLHQANLIELSNWCKHNAVTLRRDNCKKISLYRCSPVPVNYYLDCHLLGNVRFFNDLGVFVDSKLSFHTQNLSVVNKSKSILSKQFVNPYIIERLFVVLIKSNYNTPIDFIKSVQKLLLRQSLLDLDWEQRMFPVTSEKPHLNRCVLYY